MEQWRHERQALSLLRQGKSITRIAQITGLSEVWLRLKKRELSV